MTLPFLLPKIIGHRGACGHAPENTLASFELAAKLGATWIELDVKETKDGVLIIMHDDTLDRTSNGKGAVANAPLKHIQTLDAGSWYSEKFAKEKIPTLEESVTLFSHFNLGVNLEIKPCPNKETSTAVAVANFIKEKWPSNIPKPLISSFSMESLLIAKNENPDLIIGALFEGLLPDNWEDLAKKVQAFSIHLDDEIVTPEMISQIKNKGYSVLVYTVNSKKRAEELFQMGVTSIFTNYPEYSSDFQ